MKLKSQFGGEVCGSNLYLFRRKRLTNERGFNVLSKPTISIAIFQEGIKLKLGNFCVFVLKRFVVIECGLGFYGPFEIIIQYSLLFFGE